jgi:hypothetical protein
MNWKFATDRLGAAGRARRRDAPRPAPTETPETPVIREGSTVEVVVDFMAHVMYGRILASGHDQRPSAIFRLVADRVDSLEKQLGGGAFELLHGIPWTKAIKNGPSGSQYADFRGAFVAASLFYLEEALNRQESGLVSLNAAVVGAIVVGRHVTGRGSKDDGLRTLRELRQAGMKLADDGTYERLVVGLTGVGPHFNVPRARLVGSTYGPGLPNWTYTTMRVSISSTEDDLPGVVESSDLHVIGPVGAGAAWVEQVAADARYVPLAEGRVDDDLPRPGLE